MDSRLSIPLLTPSTRYSEWKLKMIASLKIQGLYEVSIGLGKESYEHENDSINFGDRYFGTICLAFLQSCATLLILLNTQRISGQNWIEPLASIMRIIIEIWRAHPTSQELFIKNYWPLFSLMKFFKMTKMHNIQHIQFELKKVSL